jgi:chromosomal replication initiation ATPase DnaA
MSGEKPQRQRRPVHPQLTFELSPAPAYEADDFLISASNEQAFGMVNLWPHWPEQLLLLVGPRGAGKSHLGAIWAAKAQANQCSANSLAAADAEALAARPLLLENADQIGGAEAELFHLINLVRERGTALVLTARSHPALWGLRTADLLSRLRLAPVAEIGAPDEALVQAVLVKLLVERQLATDAGVVSYAAARLERSLDAARTFVAALDREALARQSRITRAVAADVLSVLNFGEGGGGTEGGTQGPT